MDKGLKKSDIAKKFSISASTLSTFIKDRNKIEKSVESDSIGPQRKRIRTADYEQIDKAV